MSTITQEAVSLDSVSQSVFVAGNANLAAPEVRRSVASFIYDGGSIDDLLTLTRGKVIAAMANRGDKTDAESVDKKFLTNGYQRPIYLGALIAKGIEAEVVAAFTSVNWEDIKSCLSMSVDEAKDVLASKAAAIALKKEADKAAKAEAQASLASTAPAFKASVEAVLGQEMTQEAKNLLLPIFTLLKGTFQE